MNNIDKMIKRAAEILAEKHDICVDELDYIGYADMSWKAPDAIQIMFNINCEGHPNNHSSVAVNSWNM